jgi:crotonobetainyl-CoA:carnitine CoA-transferase CaiB-like acyl-CoA transferase
MGPLAGIKVVEIAGIGPPQFSVTHQEVSVPPSVGQHTKEILQEISK